MIEDGVSPEYVHVQPLVNIGISLACTLDATEVLPQCAKVVVCKQKNVYQYTSQWTDGSSWFDK